VEAVQSPAAKKQTTTTSFSDESEGCRTASAIPKARGEHSQWPVAAQSSTEWLEGCPKQKRGQGSGNTNDHDSILNPLMTQHSVGARETRLYKTFVLLRLNKRVYVQVHIEPANKGI
jgi:hypothetical protein